MILRVNKIFSKILVFERDGRSYYDVSLNREHLDFMHDSKYFGVIISKDGKIEAESRVKTLVDRKNRSEERVRNLKYRAFGL